MNDAPDQPTGPIDPWQTVPPPGFAPVEGVSPSPFATPWRVAHQTAPYDLLIRGGEVLDPSQGLRAPRDVAFAWGRVAAVATPGTIGPRDARSVIDASGKLVTPGLVDLHTHVYVGGAELSLPPDEACLPFGTTTVVDAGTAGANSMLGLYRQATSASQTRTRVFALVHISTIGLVVHPHGESRDLTFLEPELAAQCILRYPGFVLGVKVRQTDYIVGDNGLEPLRRAIRAAELAQAALDEASARSGSQPGGQPDGRRVAVMVHVGGTPEPLAAILALLRPGDVVTHCFSERSGMVDAAGRLEPACVEARARGVRFDVGHGSGSLSHRVASAAAERGFWPDTISTDLHSGSVNQKAVDMPTTMSKFLSFGARVEDVVDRATQAPAAFINGCLPAPAREPLLGTLQVGAPGDAAVLDFQEGEFPFVDAALTRWTGTQRLVPVHTVLGGKPWARPFPQPYLVP